MEISLITSARRLALFLVIAATFLLLAATPDGRPTKQHTLDRTAAVR